MRRHDADDSAGLGAPSYRRPSIRRRATDAVLRNSPAPDGGTTVAQADDDDPSTVQCQTSSRPSDRQSSAFRVREAAGRATRLRLMSPDDLQRFATGTWGCRDGAPAIALS